MKLFIKILLFVLVSLVTNVYVVSSDIPFINVQEVITSYSFHRELPEIDFKVIENDWEDCCKNEHGLVDYRNWGAGVEVVATKGGLAEARALGIAGEEAVGVGSKVRIESLTGTAKYRIPDILTPTTLGEVKKCWASEFDTAVNGFSFVLTTNGTSVHSLYKTEYNFFGTVAKSD